MFAPLHIRIADVKINFDSAAVQDCYTENRPADCAYLKCDCRNHTVPQAKLHLASSIMLYLLSSCGDDLLQVCLLDAAAKVERTHVLN